jgi:hypothetical protein
VPQSSEIKGDDQLPLLLNLIGIFVGGCLWLLVLHLAQPMQLPSSLMPVMFFVIGLTINQSFFDFVAKRWPLSFLAQGSGLSFLWRQVIGLGGLVSTIAWFLLSR